MFRETITGTISCGRRAECVVRVPPEFVGARVRACFRLAAPLAHSFTVRVNSALEAGDHERPAEAPSVWHDVASTMFVPRAGAGLHRVDISLLAEFLRMRIETDSPSPIRCAVDATILAHLDTADLRTTSPNKATA